MVLRYYRWLPLELEPDYREGFTCDHCHNDFLDAPLYHEEATGTDYCVECGEAAGYTVFSGLVGALLFSNDGRVLRDADSNAIVSFAYKVDTQTVGLFFVNNSTIMLRLQLNGTVREALSWTFRDGQIVSKLRLTSAEVHQRLPWLSEGLSSIFDLEIMLHPLPTLPTAMEDVCVTSFDATDEHIRIYCTEDYLQTFDLKQGREIVSKNTMAISAFAAEAPDECSKAEASVYLRDASTVEKR